MGVMVGTNKPKFQCGSLKVKKIYKGTTQIYSSGNVCTYTVRGVNYTQEYEEGQDVLHPTVVSPSLSGATFLGWSTSASSTSTVNSLVMGDSPIHLYAVFRYANATHSNLIPYGLVAESDARTGNRTSYATIIDNIPVYKYSSYKWVNVDGLVKVNGDDGYMYREQYGYVGFQDINIWSLLGSVSTSSTEDDATLSLKNKSVSGNLNSNATSSKFSIRAIIAGGNDFVRGECYLSTGTLYLYGKTVVG